LFIIDILSFEGKEFILSTKDEMLFEFNFFDFNISLEIDDLSFGIEDNYFYLY
jgi:hypothetical protein